MKEQHFGVCESTDGGGHEAKSEWPVGWGGVSLKK